MPRAKPEPVELAANGEPESELGQVEADNYSRLHMPESEGMGNADANDLPVR